MRRILRLVGILVGAFVALGLANDWALSVGRAMRDRTSRNTFAAPKRLPSPDELVLERQLFAALLQGMALPSTPLVVMDSDIPAAWIAVKENYASDPELLKCMGDSDAALVLTHAILEGLLPEEKKAILAHEAFHLIAYGKWKRSKPLTSSPELPAEERRKKTLESNTQGESNADLAAATIAGPDATIAGLRKIQKAEEAWDKRHYKWRQRQLLKLVWLWAYPDPHGTYEHRFAAIRKYQAEHMKKAGSN